MHKGKSWGQRYRVRQSDKGLTLCHPSFVSTPGMRCQVKEALRGLLKATEFDFFKGGLDGLSKPLKTFSGFQFLSFLSSNLFFFPSTPSMSTLSPFVRISISTFSIPFSSSFQYHFLPYSKTKKKKSPFLGTQGRTKRPTGKDILVFLSTSHKITHIHFFLSWHDKSSPCSQMANPVTVWITFLPLPFHSLPHTHKIK